MTGAVVVGASGGIGAALVRAIAEGGAHMPVHALSRTGPCAGSEPHQTRSGIIRPGRIDVTDESSVAAAAAALAPAGPVGLTIVASGLLHREGVAPEKTIRALDPSAMEAVLAVNAIGPALVAKHFVPLMPHAGRCVFAALSARVGSIGDNRLGGWYAYRASKAALNQVLRTLAVEVARTRPDAVVVGLHPGTVTSDLSRPFRPDPSRPGVFSPDESAARLLAVLDGLGPGDTGRVFAWDGAPVPP